MPSSGRPPPAAAAAAAAATPRRPRRRRRGSSLVVAVGLALLGVVVALGGLLLLGGAGLGGLELGGDQRVVLGAQVDLVVEVAAGGRAVRSRSSGASSFSRLNGSICWTVTSSWWAIHASVRPWRTQLRIWLR